MHEYCQNPLCEKEATREVRVSVEQPADGTRSLCNACKVAFDWGLQHGGAISVPRRVWVLAVTDMGLVAHSGAFRTRRKAVQGLAEYLKTYEGYDGPAEMPAISDWLAGHDEGMGVDIFPAPLSTS